MKKVPISVLIPEGLSQRFEKKAQELELPKAAVLRCAMLHFLELPNDEQWRIVERDAKQIRMIDLCAKKKLLKKKIEDIDQELREMNAQPGAKHS
jgi:hypothetical protein